MDLVTTILLVLISITIGYLLNALVTSTRKGAGDEADRLPPPASVRKEEVSLWRDPHSQQLRVESGGEVFQSPAELSDEQRERLAGLAGEFGRWFSAAPEPPPQKPFAETPIRHLPGQPEQEKLPSTAVNSEPERPSLNPFKIFTRALRAAEKPSGAASPESIVAQIDALLQARLEGTHLATRGIRLVESQGQGLAVQVGLKSYASLEAVPDPEVRAVIRQAVADWEARMGK